MRLIFAEQAWEDYQYWLQTDRKITRRINELIKDTSKYSVDDQNGVAAGTSDPPTIFTGMHFVRDTRVLPC